MRLHGVVGRRGRGRGVARDDPPGVNDARDPAEDRQADVDEEVGAAARLEEDWDGWEEEREEV